MKKVLTVLMVMAMVLTMALPTLAATDNFIKSPSGNPAPELRKVERPDEDCTAELNITPYSERDDLDDESRKAIEEAYDTIKNNEEGSSLDKAFEKLATEDHPAGVMAISDLFDIGYVDCDLHNDHDPVKVYLSAETVDHFVGLLVYVNGEWKTVDGATVDKKESTLSFHAAEFGPYAIAVDSTFAGDSADTGDAGISWIWLALLGVSGAGLIAITIVYRKSMAKDHA